MIVSLLRSEPTAAAALPSEALISPSLYAPAAAEKPAFELKFLIPLDLAAEIQAWAQTRMAIDPYADPALDGAYRTTTVYCDTPDFEVFRRLGRLRRRKFRIRRYGEETLIYLERKSKWGSRVKKRRSAVGEPELDQLTLPLSANTWPGHWFHRRLAARRMRPVCSVAYERAAFAGMNDEGPVRLTIDRKLLCQPVGDWTPTPFANGLPLLAGQAILEFKYRAVLPLLFKELTHRYAPAPGPVSKYRLGVQAWRLAEPAKEVG